MIARGTGNISNAFLGTTQVQAIYMGTELVWPVQERVFGITPASLELIGESGSTSFTVESDMAFTVTNVPAWVTLSAASGESGTTVISVDYEANAGSPRSIDMSVVSGDMVKILNIRQSSQAAYLNISTNSLSFAYSAQEKSVTITSNYPWSASTSSDYVTLTPASGGAGTSTLKIKLNANSGSARQATITVASNGIEEDINASQAEKPTLSVSPSSLSFASGAGEKTFTVDCNYSFSITGNPSWITLSANSGAAGRTSIKATASANTGNARSATLTVNCNGTTKTVAISQAAYVEPTLSISPTNIQFLARAGVQTRTMTLTSNVPWTITDGSDGGCTTSPHSGNAGTTTVRFTTDGGYSPDSSETVTITYGNKTKKVTVAYIEM